MAVTAGYMNEGPAKEFFAKAPGAYESRCMHAEPAERSYLVGRQTRPSSSDLKTGSPQDPPFKRDGVMTPEKFFHAGPVNGWRRR